MVFCDLPTVSAGPGGRFLVTQMAAAAEPDARLISQRTRAALAVAKARGVKLGNPRLVPGAPAMAAVARAVRSRQVAERTADVLAVLRQVQDEGASSLRTLAAELQARGVLTPAGKAHSSAGQVRRVLVRSGSMGIEM